LQNMDAQELQRLKNKYDIIGKDAMLDRAIETAVAIAPTDLTVLITGESGVGKDNIPKIIHQNSRRKNEKYFAVNCGAIPEGTIDSELFGHVKGSFTGAVETRKGYFEEANGGTLFLDEIGELPLPSQAKLLRVLQSGEYIKVGSSKVEKTDVRVVAATNNNLLHAISQGKFREDLYYRLNAIQVKMPSLRERPEDIYLLFRKFTADCSAKYGICKIALTDEAQALLKSYRWPGNIRQLKNFAESVTVLESKPLTPSSERVIVDAGALAKYLPTDPPGEIVLSDGKESSFPASDKEMILNYIRVLAQEVDSLRKIVQQGGATAVVPQSPLPLPSHVSMENKEDNIDIQEPDVYVSSAPVKKMEGYIVGETKEDSKEELPISIKESELVNIKRALDECKGNRRQAAEMLGISERTLYRKILKFGLDK